MLARGIKAIATLAVLAAGFGAQADSDRAIKGRAAAAAITWAAENGHLRQLLEEFPKGGELHTHLRGAVYAESWLRWAAEDGLCADMETVALRFRPEAGCADSGWIEASAAEADGDMRRKLINAMSTRSYVPTNGWSGHDQFFSTFDRISVMPQRLGDQLAELAERAGEQNVVYLEIMETIVLPELFPLLSGVELTGDMAADYATLMNGPFGKALPELKASISRQIADAMAKKDRLLGCGTENARPGCDVEIRLLHQVIREFSPAMVFGQFILGWAVMDTDPMVVGLNLVAPEDGLIALRDYSRHMGMIDYLYTHHGPRNIALHAGELTLGLVKPDELKFHIREAIEVGHAKRIGHGIDIAHERDSEALLKHMADDGILVEINLTSNDMILGVRGEDHPLTLYRYYDVPYALSTDDEGVSRIDLTHEYMRYYTGYNVPYFEMRQVSRNALTYSFLPGESLWTNRACVEDIDRGRAAGEKCRALIDTSDKARLQWKLEDRLRVFEDETRIPKRKTTSYN